MAEPPNQPHDDRITTFHLESWAEDLEIPTDEASTSLEYLCNGVAGFEETQRRGFDAAGRRLRPTEVLRTQAQLFESAFLCGHQLRQDLAKLPAMARQAKSPALRLCIMQLLLVLCDIYPELSKSTTAVYPRMRWATLSHNQFLSRVVQEMLQQGKQDSRLLSLARDLAAYNMLWQSYDYKYMSQEQCGHVFRILYSILGPDNADTLLALKYMVEALLLYPTYAGYRQSSSEEVPLLRWDWRPLLSWPAVETSCRRHGQQLQADFGADHPAYVRHLHGVGRLTLEFGSRDAAKTILHEAFRRREKAFGEVHSETLTFIDGLLETYCQEGAGKPRRDLEDSSAEVLNSLLVDELVELCLGREAYEEVDDLVQECRFPHKGTDIASPNEDFAHWSQFERKQGCKIQPRLASFKSPPGSFYWEDSRMYLRTWSQVKLTAASPEGPSTRLPAKITVTEAGMEDELPADCRNKGYSSTDPEPYQHVRSSDIWKLLDAKRLARDWKILLAWKSQDRDPECRALVEGPPNHEFYVFEDSLVISDSLEQAQQPMSKTYRFKKLPTPGSQWLVMTQDRQQSLWRFRAQAEMSAPDQNEPVPGDESGKYKTHQLYIPDQLRFSVFQHRIYDKISVGKLVELAYNISDAGPKHVNLVVPYVKYAHFKNSSAYHAGLSYQRFIDILRWWSVGSSFDDTDIEHATDICTGVATADANVDVPAWHPSGLLLSELPTRNGFLNGIPGDSAVIHDGSKTPFSLVSSSWKDWKRFVLHQAIRGQAPDLKLPSGQSVRCRGFIMGTWTDAGCLEKQWSGLSLYVVDCEFGSPASGDTHHFFLNTSMLRDGNLHLLSGWDKKLLCAELNFCLFRHARCSSLTRGSVWKPSRKKKEEPVVQNVFWAEMNRRENWDREYEKTLRSSTCKNVRHEGSSESPLATLERNKEAEEKFRLEWDLKHVSLQKALRSVGNG